MLYFKDHLITFVMNSIWVILFFLHTFVFVKPSTILVVGMSGILRFCHIGLPCKQQDTQWQHEQWYYHPMKKTTYPNTPKQH